MESMNTKPFDSIKLVKETETEFIYKCPFCGDSQKHSMHGHLYLSKKFPIFYCQRCSTYGSIEKLENFLHEKCKASYNTVLEYNLPNLDISTILQSINELLKFKYLSLSNEEKLYFQQRTKLKNMTIQTAVKFSLYPDSDARNYLLDIDPIRYKLLKNHDSLRTWTMRGFGTGISGRSIQSNNSIRYVNGEYETPWSKYLDLDSYFIRSYCIQNYNINVIPNTLIIAEGIYDICNIYLNRNRFLLDDKESLFVAVQCSTYSRGLKIYNILYNSLPKNIIVFADSGIDPDKLKEQFRNAISNKCKVTINYPMYKDWDPIGLIKYSINL